MSATASPTAPAATAQFASWLPGFIETVDRADRWTQWAALDPRLACFSSLREAVDAWRYTRDEQCYPVVTALASLGSRRSGDDDDAALAIVALLEEALKVLHYKLRDLCTEDEVTNTLWEVVKDAEPHIGTNAAQYLMMRTRTRLSTPTIATGCLFDNRKSEDEAPRKFPHPSMVSLAVDPRDDSVDWTGAHGGPGRQLEDPLGDLVDLLTWARGVGVVAQSEVELLVELIAAENDGMLREPAMKQVGAKHGMALRTVRRRRDQITARLRDAAPDYLAAIA